MAEESAAYSSESRLRPDSSQFQQRIRELKEIQFDELVTFEHTKMKPVSVHLAVDAETRKILGVQVSQMPAQGLLAAKSRKKYGKRKDMRSQGLKNLLKQISPWIGPTTQFRSDSKWDYRAAVKGYFPKNNYIQEISRRPRSYGLGELKKGGNDPLFSLNHTCAMFRANVNRLARKTWCTTKKPQRLLEHLYLYARFHNKMLVGHGAPTTALGIS